MPSESERTLRHAVIDAYRQQLVGRYALDNIHRFKEFEDLPKDKLEALRDFFMTYIYPPADEREQLDAASDQVKRMLMSPRQLMPLAGVALGSIRKFGANLPKAASTTRATMEAFEKTRELEDVMIAYCQREGITHDELENGDVMPQVIAHVPRKDVDAFRNDVLALFEAMATATFLEPAIEIMERGLDVVRKRPKIYSKEDLEGFEYGRKLLRGCLELHDQLEPDDIPKILEGIRVLELDWYENIIREAEAQSAS